MIKKALTIFWRGSFNMPSYLSINNIPSLDGLRAVAILWVLAGHLRNSLNMPATGFQILDTIFGGGQLGVKLFFVISGFLITTLLIKEKINTRGINLKKFYIRRFLRIFPVFYLYILVVLAIGWYLHLPTDKLAFGMAALYLTNFIITSSNWSIVHSWSLAVEEQYYLLWPSVFKKSTRLAIVVAALFIAIAPLLRVFVYYHPSFAKVLLAPFINDADSIFIGSMVAIIAGKGIINPLFFSRYKIIITLAGFLLVWLISYATLHGKLGKLLLPFGTTCTAIIFAAIILCNIMPAKDLLFRLLNSRGAKLVGRLSYSIYVWQQLFLLAPAHFPMAAFSWNYLPVNLLLVAAVSTASYYGFEKYFLTLKAKFKV